MATTVIIPARNEEVTVTAVVQAFQDHPETNSQVFVGIDADTVDHTVDRVLDAYGVPIPLSYRGKGQVVSETVKILGLAGLLSDRIILCDADYTGLTADHITQILAPKRGMVIGVPDWPEIDVPAFVTNAWPTVSGFRCLPHELVPVDGHGYLLETQMNVAAVTARLPIRQIFMAGLKSPFQWPMAETRRFEWARDRGWAMRHGLLPEEG